MTRDDILALLAKRQEAWDRLDASALAGDHSEDCIVESPLAGGAVKGRDAIEKLYATYFRGFPDMKMRQEDLLIDGDRVALLLHGSGTDRGGFMGMAPTGRTISLCVVFLYDLQNGMIVRERRIYDFTGVLVQVGAIKAKPI